MADPRFTGSCVALVTPFRDGRVDERALVDLVRFHHDGGTDALLVCGSTGEAATMSSDEQRRALEAVLRGNEGRLPVLAGCGGSGTAEVAALARQAAEAGADAILVSAPPYNKPPQRGLIEHFRRVMHAADLPMVIYNVPGRTSVNMLPDTILAIAEDERVIGVKEACADLSQIADLARLLPERVALWSGNDDQTLPILSLGGTGVISVLANVTPEPVSRRVHAWLEGDVATARDLQLRYLPLVRALFAEANPIPVKTAVGWLGLHVGELRPPLVPISQDVADRLEREMRGVGLSPRR